MTRIKEIKIEKVEGRSGGSIAGSGMQTHLCWRAGQTCVRSVCFCTHYMLHKQPQAPILLLGLGYSGGLLPYHPPRLLQEPGPWMLLMKGKLPLDLRTCPFFLVLSPCVQEVSTHLRPGSLEVGGRLWWQMEGLTAQLVWGGHRAHAASQLLPGRC